jgi:methylated-DNA-protein-cysteine methyltransferase-like protein
MARGKRKTERGDREHLQQLFRAIYRVVRRIPRGCVATYGEVAELAGIPRGGRVAGAALKTSTPAMRLPWHRVVGKAGKLRARIAIHDPVGAAIQRGLLEREGVAVGDRGLVRLDVHGWLTAGSGRAASPRRRPRSASTRRASPSRR